MNIKHDARHIAVCDAIVKLTIEWRGTSDGVEYHHAVTLLVSIYQQISLVAIDTNKNNVIGRH